VSAHALSPDGRRLVTAGENALDIWDTVTGKLLRTIRVEGGGSPAGPYMLSAFSPDGTVLAAASGKPVRQVTVWDPATGRQLRSWTAGKMPLTNLAFAGDANTLITADDHNVIRSWDVLTGGQKREIVRHPSTIKILALSPDGKLLATVGQTPKPGGPGVPGVLFFIADPFIRLWDVATGKEVRRLDEPAAAQKADDKRGFESVVFAAGGKVLLAGSAGGVLYACEPAGKELRRVWQGTPFLRALAASADGKTAAVASGAVVRPIDLASGKEVFLGAGHPTSAYKTAVTPDGKTIVTASHCDLFLWDASSGRLRKRLHGHNGYINGLEIIDGGRKAVTSAYQDGTLRVWDLIAEKEAYRIKSPDKANILQAVSPDGKTIAVGGSNSLTVLYDARTGKEIRRLEGHGEFNDYGAAFTPDGRMLAVWYVADNMVYLWDLATGRKIREYTFIDGDPPRPNPGAGGRPVYFAAVSPDGRLIAFGSQSRFLEVRDLASGTVLYRRTKLPDGICPMAFSPDSRMLAWSGWWNDPTVHLVEIATGTDRRRFAGHTGRVLSLSFSADGSMLVSGSGDTTALVWDLTGKLAAGEEWCKPLSAKDMEAAWHDLAGDNAGRAFDAICRLSAAPQEPVAFLRRQLRPVAAVDAKRIARLIGELDAEAFAAREKATRELEALGERAVEACRKALAGAPSAETRRRLEGLLVQIAYQTGQPPPDRLRVLRALEVLERAGAAEARDVLATLARGAPGARLTEDARAALQRLDSRSARK
jgi:WD40 repeat protein